VTDCFLYCRSRLHPVRGELLNPWKLVPGHASNTKQMHPYSLDHEFFIHLQQASSRFAFHSWPHENPKASRREGDSQALFHSRALKMFLLIYMRTTAGESLQVFVGVSSPV
jgi:hypothetical protein